MLNIGGNMAKRQLEERLGMLAAKSVDLDATFGGFGGIVPVDIAAALNSNGTLKVLRGPYLYMLAKYAGDMGVVPELQQHVYKMVIETANELGWQTKHRTGLHRLSELALIESELLPQRCGQCKGRAWVIKKKLKVPCEACGGTGNYRRSKRARARYLGIDHKGYIHTWEFRLAKVTGTLKQWEIDVLEKLRRELG